MSIPKHIQFARELRKNQTREEKLFWMVLRNRKFHGFKFLRQHPIIVSVQQGRKVFYIADFYCAEKKLVIELDGGIHLSQQDYDRARDAVMNEMNYTVLRISNDEVKKDFKKVLNKIKEHL